MGGIDPELAGDALFRAAGAVAGAGVVVLDGGGHGGHTVGQAGEAADDAGELAVDALGQPAGAFQQGFPRGDGEARVRAEHGEEASEAAVEAGRGNFRIHFGAYAGDFGLADGEYLVRR